MAKFICAFLIVSIHVAPFGDTDNALLKLLNYGIQNGLARIAVPFFFATSGFLLYRKSSIENFSIEKTKVYVLKLLRLYAIWSLIYFPLKIGTIISDENGIIHGILKYCRDVIFVGSYTQLWYFPALIFSAVVISYLLSKGVSLKKVICAALCFYAAGLLAQSWFGIIKPLQFDIPVAWEFLLTLKKIIVTTRSGLFEGLLFVGFGAIVAFYGFRLPQRKALMGFVMSFILMFVEAFACEYFGLARAHDMYIFLVPLTWFAFGAVVNCRIPKSSSIFKTLRVLSSLIFYIHLWIKDLIWKSFSMLGFEIEKTCFLFILTASVSVALAYGIYKLSDCNRFRWLKKLYS